ncbi:unnamed protein product [Paramecium sonneborni]|uniref:Uncharacterized protein n=1 Tax=Paramecium sonneborni TaxID=65129 RepID=A0A8S1RHM4_9CILI|nr:unnamed protein product [Paramecium sonneborni]
MNNSNQGETAMSRFDLFIQAFKQWMLTIINEASIGLYQIQCHLKDSILYFRKVKEEEEKLIKKLSIVNTQQQNTIVELKEIGNLNREWAPKMQKLLDQLQQKNDKK